MEEIRTIVDNYEDAVKTTEGIFENILLDGTCYKPFVHEDEIYIPVVVCEPVYRKRDTHLAGIERHITYQKISKELIKAVIE